jgi:MFS family permease
MTTLSKETRNASPMRAVLSHRDYRLFWMGQTTSFIGDQFHMIAAPWLVLQLTNNPVALGALLALAGIPRGVFMLIGGALTDRFSARTIMIITDLVRLVAVALLAGLTFTGTVQIWMLFIIALVIGIASGFFGPASSSMIPTLVSKDELSAGNSIFQATAELTQFVGPALAGGLIAWSAHVSGVAGAQADYKGMGIAFLIDASTFLVSVITLLLMSDGSKPLVSLKENILESIRQGLAYAWDDEILRLMFILIAFANLTFIGPVMVGMPVLASTRLPGGAAAYGIIMSAFAGGNLIGILSAGVLPKPGGKNMRLFLLALLASFGIGLASFGWITATWQAVAVLMLLGMGNGYLGLTLITMIQHRTPAKLLGRIMSLVLLANIGMAPLSQALAGVISRWNLSALFGIAGAVLLVVTAWAAFQPELYQMGIELDKFASGEQPAD